MVSAAWMVGGMRSTTVMVCVQDAEAWFSQWSVAVAVQVRRMV